MVGGARFITIDKHSARTIGEDGASRFSRGYATDFNFPLMRSPNDNHDVPVTKNADNEGPIPSVWRPVLKSIVDAFAREDYLLKDGISGVAPISEETAQQVREYIEDYGAKLVELPPQSWDTSVCIWVGDRWDALIDLWTEDEGRSDLVLEVDVSEAGSGYVVAVHMVYVP
jgi:hypothetical protein